MMGNNQFMGMQQPFNNMMQQMSPPISLKFTQVQGEGMPNIEN